MNEAQLHLLTNHLPVMGSLFTVLLMLWGIVRKSDEIQKVALGAMVLVALTALPAYFTGEPAHHLVEHLPGVSEAHIEEHESMGKFALTSAIGLGVVALAGLILSRGKPVSLAVASIALVANLFVAGVMGYTAHLGGQIRHSEIRGEGAPATTEGETHTEEEHD